MEAKMKRFAGIAALVLSFCLILTITLVLINRGSEEQSKPGAPSSLKPDHYSTSIETTPSLRGQSTFSGQAALSPDLTGPEQLPAQSEQSTDKELAAKPVSDQTSTLLAAQAQSQDQPPLDADMGPEIVAGPRKRSSGKPDPQMTGCRRPTAQDLAWMKANMIDEKVVVPNTFGLKRINVQRQKQGLAPVTIEQVKQLRAADSGNLSSKALSARIRPVLKVRSATENVSAPAVVDNSLLQWFPPIRSQAGLGSCAAFSTTYYTMTYMTAMARGWDVTDTGNTNKFSPKWTYNMINGGNNNGSSMIRAFQVMESNGCATWSDFPYVGSTTPATNYLEWSVNGDVWRDAINYRTGSQGYISSIETDAGISNLKDKLNNGFILNYATHIYDWKYKTTSDNPDSSDDDSYVGQQICYTQAGGIQDSGHAMTVVGYNDAVWVDIDGDGDRDAGEVGAFKIANSWGTGYRNSGFCWYSYSALKESGNWWSNRAYWIEARASYEPKMIARFTVNHSLRNQMYMSTGIGDVGDAIPDSSFYPAALSYDGGAWAFDGTSTACDAEFCLDFTDIAPALGVNKRWFLRFLDNSTDGVGAIKSFTLYNVTRGETLATVTPGADPGNFNPADGVADNESTYAWIDAKYLDNTNTPPSISNITNKTIAEDGDTGALSVTVGDTETDVGDLLLSGSSSDQTLVANSSIVFGGTGANRTVTVSPELNQHGTTTITVTVTDGGALESSDTFLLTVTAVNDAPVISTSDPGTPFSMEAGDTQTFIIWPHDDDNDSMTCSWKLDGADISESDDDFDYSPVPGVDEGPHTIEVTVSDGNGGSNSHLWNVTVTPAIIPYIECNKSSLALAVRVGKDAAEQTFTVSNVGTGTLNYSVTDDQTWLSCAPASGNASTENDLITVSFTTSELEIGTYNATITVSDTGGNAGNGPETIEVTLTVKKKSSSGGGGCGLNSGSKPFGAILPYLAIGLLFLASRLKRKRKLAPAKIN
jgi:C1A family cysteine protease